MIEFYPSKLLIIGCLQANCFILYKKLITATFENPKGFSGDLLVKVVWSFLLVWLLFLFTVLVVVTDCFVVPLEERVFCWTVDESVVVFVRLEVDLFVMV